MTGHKNSACHVESNFPSPGNCHGSCDDNMMLPQPAWEDSQPNRCLWACGTPLSNWECSNPDGPHVSGWWFDPESHNYSHLDGKPAFSPSSPYKGVLKTDSSQSGSHLEIPMRKELCSNAIISVDFICYDMTGNYWENPLPGSKWVCKDVTN